MYNIVCLILAFTRLLSNRDKAAIISLSINMTLNKILRWCIYVGLFSVTLAPLIVTPSSLISLSMYFPFITGKNFLFRIVVEIIFGLWLVLAYRDKSARPKSSFILWALLAYLAAETLATIFGQVPLRSFWSNFERMEGLVSYIHNFLFFLVMISVLKSAQAWRWLLKTSLGVSLIISWYGILQLAGKMTIHQSGSRLDATLGNSAYMAVFMLFNIAIAFYLLVSSRNKTAKWVYGAIAALETVILYFTATRGATLGLLGGIILFLIIAAWKKAGRTRRISLYVLGSIALLVVLFIGIKNTSFVQNNEILSRYASLSITGNSLIGRKQIWGMGWQGFKEHPLLGWGPENFPLVFQKYYTPQMYGQEPWFDRAHNVIFDKLINAGLVGLLAYLSIFAAALYYLYRGSKEGDRFAERAVIVSLLAGYFFQNLTVFDQVTSVIMFYIILGFIHGGFAAPAEERPKPAGEGVWLPFVVLGATALTVFSVYYFNVRGITASASLIRAISPQSDPRVPLENFKTIFAYSAVTGQSEAREQLMNVAQTISHDTNVSEDLKGQYAALVTTEMAREFAYDPDDARARLFYGTYLDAIGSTGQGIAELEKAVALSPQKQIILIQLGMAYINSGKTDQGMALFKKAFDEEPNYAEARKLYALAALYTGKPALASEIIGPNPAQYINDDRFLSYFVSTKQYAQVLLIWQQRQAANPKDKQTNISLAGSYYYTGDRAKAIEVIQNYIKIDPAFAAEGENIIKSIELGQVN